MSHTPAAAYVAVYQAQSDASWPYDHGDDPSFHASLVEDRPLTWGICRTDLRRLVREGDLVVFIATDRLRDRTPGRYRLAGWATVEREVSHTDIWLDPDLHYLQSYKNLLVRPRPGSDDFDHFESAEPWHTDWLWRLSPRVPYLKKAKFDAASATDVLVDGMVSIDRSRLNPAKSYVIFRTAGDGTEVLADPPTVALAHRTGEPEVWEATELALTLRSLLLTGTGRAGLRTTNKEQAHRHIKCRRSASDLREALAATTAANRLEYR